MEFLLGLSLVALTYFTYAMLNQRDEVIRPVVRKDILVACAMLGLVATLSIGTVYAIHGLVRHF